MTDVLFLKPGISGTECLSPQSGHYVEAPPGSDVNIAALFGTPAPTINNPSLAACVFLSTLVNVSVVAVDVTYDF